MSENIYIYIYYQKSKDRERQSNQEQLIFEKRRIFFAYFLLSLSSRLFQEDGLIS